MKRRMGFVSNSSSSSFVCEICHNTESGYDLTLSEAEMVECANYHCVCEAHIDVPKEYVRNPDFFNGDYLKPEHCPICQMRQLPDSELLAFMLKEARQKKVSILTRIRERFPSYQMFKRWIDEK